MEAPKGSLCCCPEARVRRQALRMNTDAAVDLERAMGPLRPKRSPPPPPPSRTKWTRLVHPSVLIGRLVEPHAPGRLGRAQHQLRGRGGGRERGADADGAARPILALSFGRGSELWARRVPSGAGGKIR